MLYEKKRTFTGDVVDLSDALLAVDTAAYAGTSLAATSAGAGALDYEVENQHFPDENTIEVYGKEDADSAADGASVAVAILSSADGETYKTEVEFTLAQASIKDGKLLKRFTIPAQASRYLQAKLTVAGEVFTAGKLFMTVAHL